VQSIATRGKKVSRLLHFLRSLIVILILTDSFFHSAGKASCTHIAEYLAGAGFVPDARAQDYCFIFDKDVYAGNQLSDESKLSVSNFCGVSDRSCVVSTMRSVASAHSFLLNLDSEPNILDIGPARTPTYPFQSRRQTMAFTHALLWFLSFHRPGHRQLLQAFRA
jgi:hypothetical protein